ncbi:aldo/keto reductase [Rhizorhabdus argentea]|uniref:aldo/keto reductase n=1 Tax=Rhizorhabdus argentea TaxID=1387174 RepID=UPI0030EEE074
MEFITAGGANIPALGLGTMFMTDKQIQAVVATAIEAGVRHFDAAQIYGTEAFLGAALENSGSRRDELFITTKIWGTNLAPDRFAASLDESLEKLRTDHVDLLLLHWPNEAVPLEVQIESLETARASGKARHIGVSNFSIDWLDRALALAQSPLVTNQIEIHPYCQQPRLVDASRARGLATTAYFALAEGRAPRDPVLAEIGARYGKSAAQVALRWLLQLGHIVLTRTTNARRMPENAAVFDFTLDLEDMTRISALAEPGTRLANFEGLAPIWDD